MKFAAIQHDIVWRDRDANFEHLRVLIAEAELNGAEFVVLSETFSTGFAVETHLSPNPKVVLHRNSWQRWLENTRFGLVVRVQNFQQHLMMRDLQTLLL